MNEEHKDIQAPDFSGEKMKMPENTDTQPDAVEKPSSVVGGPVLLILTILLVAILGGMYYWITGMNDSPDMPTFERPTPEMNNEPESTTAEAQVETMQAVSTSDEINAIESDLEATNLDSLDAELNAIDAELDAAAQAEI